MRLHVPRPTIALAVVAAILYFAPVAIEAQDIPRLPDGKPDFNGIWDKPRVASVENDSTTCGAASTGCVQEGAGPLPYTDLGRERWEGYQNDWTGYCLPWGYTRAWQTSYPVEIIQTPDRMAILYESNNIFHIVRIDEEMPEELETT